MIANSFFTKSNLDIAVLLSSVDVNDDSFGSGRAVQRANSPIAIQDAKTSNAC
jgi:hypothetical protein